MALDNPYQPPAPGVLANMCAQAAWRPDIDDQCRLLLEWCADTIRLIETQRGRAMSRAERLEAECEDLKAYIVAIGQYDKGGL